MKKLFILSIAGMMSLGIQNEANAAFPVQENAKVYVAKKSQKAENAIDLNNVYMLLKISLSVRITKVS